MKNLLLIYLVAIAPINIFAQQLSYQTHEMEYDDLNRLERVVFSNGTIYEYTYDNLGNRIQRTVTEEQDDELTYVPDDAFEQKLIDLGYDAVMDDYVITANISDVTDLPLQNGAIVDMTGIEDFIALEDLSISNNQVQELALLNNVSLTELNCSDNNLISLDITQNVNLINLSCADNQLVELDTSNNTALELMFAGDNQFTELNFNNNTSLKQLFLFVNPLNNVDVTNNLNLEILDIVATNITAIDVTQNLNLIDLDISNNSISQIDLSQNPELFRMRADNTLIETLNTLSNPNLEELVMQSGFLNDVEFIQNPNLRILLLGSNALVDVDVSTNSNLEDFRISQNSLETLNVKNGSNNILTTFFATANNTLFCIQVDDENAANNGTGVYANWNVATQVEYSEDCEFLSTDEFVLEGISLYPNPTENNLFISLQDYLGSNMSYSLYDLKGRLIKENTVLVDNPTRSINVSELASGSYIIKLTIDDGAWSSNFIKQ